MSSLIAGSAFFFSCDDFLDREPLDKVTPDVYLTKEDQLAIIVLNPIRMMIMGMSWYFQLIQAGVPVH